MSKDYLTIKRPNRRIPRKIAGIALPLLFFLTSLGVCPTVYNQPTSNIIFAGTAHAKEKKKTESLEDWIKYHGVGKEIDRNVRSLTKKAVNKVTMEQILTEATRYDDYFEKAAEIVNLDKNLIKAYIMAESGHKWFAINSRSTTGAVGPAQMFPPAAREVGLKIIKTERGEMLYDERRDPEKAIIGSAKYLKKNIFNDDIILGLARYNAGPGMVRYRIKKKGTKVFTKLFRRGETRNYISRVLSRMKIVEDPKKYGLKVGKKPLYSDIRKDAEMHTIKEGETLYSLTKEYNTTLDLIRKSNPALINLNRVPVGIDVYMPNKNL